MKKIDSPISKEYSTLILELSHIESIIEILTEKENEIEISTDSVSFDSVSDLVLHSKKKRLTYLQIHSATPYANIELRPLWARFYIGSSKAESSGIFYKIDKILRSCERWPKIAYSSYFIWVLIALQWAPMFLPKPFADYMKWLNGPIFFWLMWVTFIKLRRYSFIILENEKENFFVRNSDSIKVALISAIVGALLAVWMPKVIEKCQGSGDSLLLKSSVDMPPAN